MRKVLLILVLIPFLGLTSCVKQQNCDGNLTGKFIYYEEPQEFSGCGNQGKYNALCIPDNKFTFCRIFNNIPKEFQSKDTIHVRAYFNMDPNDFHNDFLVDCRKYKLKCIEKVD
jgi:hypothetical protein